MDVVLTAYSGPISVKSIFGLLSGIGTIYAFIPYVADTVNNRTQPQRASWLIWSVLGSIAFFAQLYEGASASLWFVAAQVSGTIIVFILSIRCGSGVYLKSSDYWILCAAVFGLVLWFFAETATYSLMITITISLLGGSITVVRAFKNPDGETLSTWVIFLMASVCALFSVGSLNPTLLAYPMYLCVLYSAIVFAILLGRLIEREIDLRHRTTVVDIQL